MISEREKLRESGPRVALASAIRMKTLCGSRIEDGLMTTPPHQMHLTVRPAIYRLETTLGQATQQLLEGRRPSSPPTDQSGAGEFFRRFDKTVRAG